MNKRQKYFMKQKLIGALALLVGIIATYVTVVIFKEENGTGLIILPLFGLYLLFTKEKAFDFDDGFCEEDEES